MITRPLRSLTLLLSGLSLVVPLAAYAQDTPDIPFDAPAPKPPAASPAPVAPAPAVAPTPAAPAPAAPAPAMTTAAPAPAEVAPSAAPAAEPSSTTTRNTRLAPNFSGATGLLRISAAEGGEAGTFRLLFGVDFFSITGFFRDDDAASRVGGVLGVGYTPIEHLELWLNTRAQSTRSDLTRPELIQSLGDVALGAKGYVRVGDAVSLGADAQLALLTGIGAQTFDAAQLQLRALATFDLERAAQIPVRAHVNLGGIIDGSSGLSASQLSDAESFAQGVSDFSRFTAALGVEVPVRYVTPYLEYTLDVPVGYLATPGIVLLGATRQGLRAAQVAGNSIATDPGRAGLGRVMPQRLTPGVRVTAIPDLTLDLAVEIGLAPDTAPGVLSVPPYNVVFLASYRFDPLATRSGPPVTVPVIVPEPVITEPAPTTGLITGLVVGPEGRPLDGVVVGFDRAPPVATANNGRFLSHEIEPGPVKLTVTKDGFETASADVTVAVGQTQDVKLAMVAIVKEGTVRGRVVDTQGKPVSGATVELSGPASASVTTDGNGQLEKSLKDGEYLAVASSSGHYRAGKKVRVEKGAQQALDFTLRARSNPPVAELAGNTIKLRKRLSFTRDDQLSPQSAEILDAVADLLWANPNLKLRVEAHWDNSLPEADAQRKTTNQANAVVGYLTAQGLAADRFESSGIGSAKPIAPNITQRGKDQNRRVEILTR